MLQNGANIEVKNDYGATPLHAAVIISRCDQTVKTLIKRGANIDAKDSQGVTPLHLAAHICCQSLILELLIQNGANIEAEDDFGRRPLHAAAIEGYNTCKCIGSDRIVEMLLQKGATLDVKTARVNNTPLHLAVNFGRPSKVEMLMRFGASPCLKIRQNLGWTPLECALNLELDQNCFKVLLYNEGLM